MIAISELVFPMRTHFMISSSRALSGLPCQPIAPSARTGAVCTAGEMGAWAVSELNGPSAKMLQVKPVSTGGGMVPPIPGAPAKP